MKSEKLALIVEAEQIIAYDLKYHLNKLGYSSIHFASGEKAIENTKESSLDCIIIAETVDGELDGYQTIKKVIELNPKYKNRIIFINTTPHTKLPEYYHEDIKHILCVNKPFQYEDIENAIKKIKENSFSK